MGFNSASTIMLSPSRILKLRRHFAVSAQQAPLLGGGLTDGSNNGTVTVTEVASTPEPSSLVLLGTGILGAASVFRKRYI